MTHPPKKKQQEKPEDQKRFDAALMRLLETKPQHRTAKKKQERKAKVAK